MDATTYQSQFGRTLAPVFFPENVNPLFLGLLLEQRKQSADLIDACKRALFYGNTKKLEEMGHLKSARNDLGLDYHDEPEIIHALLGVEGEVGELSAIPFDTNLTPEQQRARVLDESGDMLWYLALLFKNYNITFEEAFAGNIAKLKKRYPDKFTVEAALNRNLEAEAGVFMDNLPAVH